MAVRSSSGMHVDRAAAALFPSLQQFLADATLILEAV
jgi:hypothetical protein